MKCYVDKDVPRSLRHSATSIQLASHRGGVRVRFACGVYECGDGLSIVDGVRDVHGVDRRHQYGVRTDILFVATVPRDRGGRLEGCLQPWNGRTFIPGH